jgi:hypothetical protein
MGEEYTKRLEKVIKQMLTPLKDIPLNLVIESITGYKILPFDAQDVKDKSVLDNLIQACNLAGEKINDKGILRKRPNEVGNDIESFVKDALKSVGFQADSPRTKSGVRKATGYPDIEFVDQFGRLNYLECKTYNIENVATTQRSFYLSPSEEFKITQDAHHFIVSFEIYVASTQGTQSVFKCRSWKILSVESLSVDVKYEFNSDNARLYTANLVLAEGKI